jgi:glycosyltransferase involved in cell wall biosynthesis
MSPQAVGAPVLRILGIRGIPAAHGGFETFAQALALHLVARGWRVVVYCQEDGSGAVVEDQWRGVQRVRIPVATPGTAGTMVFDWRAIAHAARHTDLCLTLGYNTALFNARLRLVRVPQLMNMDGIEWRRAKWGAAAKTWFWLNERAGFRLADHLVADHPEIARHLARRGGAARITTIPYGAERITPDPAFDLARFGLASGRYLTLIARAEPENSIAEVVQAFSARPRGVSLVVLGHYDAGNAYHARVRAAAGAEVRFLGAIYEPAVVQQLRAHALAYLHGHQVGGTNPSLVEALGAHNPVFAHDNPFNRWVAGEGAAYFGSAGALDAALTAFLADPAQQQRMRQASAARFEAAFTNEAVLEQYRVLLERWLPTGA